MAAVVIDRVTKTFRQHTAVDDLSLQVPEGTIYGFIGPNGSGKTTTLRMIMRILHPDSGRITVLGERSLGAANDRVGYLPEERGLYKQMKVRDVLRFYAELKGCRHSGPAIDAWLARMGLSDWAGKKVEALSKGMSQKVQFIATVVSRPELVLLDEPFSGLDPMVRDELGKALLDHHANSAILLSSHDLAEIEGFATHVAFLESGRLRLSEEMAPLKSRFREVALTLDAPVAVPVDVPRNWLQISGTDSTIRFVDDAFNENTLRSEIARRFGTPQTISISQMSLRTIFLAFAKSTRKPS